MATKAFASTGDTAEKKQTLEVLSDGVYALTAEGDPNIGAIEGEDFVVCFEALATPVVAEQWLAMLRKHTQKPVRYLLLSHYHAVRVLGAAAYNAQEIVATEMTRKLVAERGKQDWDSEFGRMPRLATGADSVKGLTWPTLTFTDKMTIQLGGQRGELVLQHMGRGHTEGDMVAWLPKHKILFAGDAVEAEAALYLGDSFPREWSTTTLDRIKAFGAETLIGGRGDITHGHKAADAAVEQTRSFIKTMIREVGAVHQAGGTLKQAFERAHGALVSDYGKWPIFEHCMPFNVSRTWDELSGIERPVIWTAERDRAVWDQLQS
jgi:glyoxylase-like metal-dependent hydrolase (beta-lactamase superfamily II)